MLDFDNNSVQDNISAAKSESDNYKHLNLIHDLQDLVVDMSIAGTTTADEDECLAQIKDIIQRLEILKLDADTNAQEISESKAALALVMQKLDAIHKNNGVAIPSDEPVPDEPAVQEEAADVSVSDVEPSETPESDVYSAPISDSAPVQSEEKDQVESFFFDNDDVRDDINDSNDDSKSFTCSRENIVEELASRNESIQRDRLNENAENKLESLKVFVKESTEKLDAMSSINFIKRRKLAQEIEKANQKIKFYETLKVKNSFKQSKK